MTSPRLRAFLDSEDGQALQRRLADAIASGSEREMEEAVRALRLAVRPYLTHH